MKTYIPTLGRKTRTFTSRDHVVQYDNGYSAQQLGVAYPHQQTSQEYDMGVKDAQEDATQMTFAQYLNKRRAALNVDATFDQRLMELCQ